MREIYFCNDARFFHLLLQENLPEVANLGEVNSAKKRKAAPGAAFRAFSKIAGSFQKANLMVKIWLESK